MGGALEDQVLSVSPPTLVRWLHALGAQKPCRSEGVVRGPGRDRSLLQGSKPPLCPPRTLSVRLAEVSPSWVLLRSSREQGSTSSFYHLLHCWEVFLDV